MKRSDGKPAAESGYQCAGPGTGTTTTPAARLDAPDGSRIGDQGRAGIGDQRHVIPCLQTLDEPPSFVALVMLMTSGQRRLDTEVRQ